MVVPGVGKVTLAGMGSDLQAKVRTVADRVHCTRSLENPDWSCTSACCRVHHSSAVMGQNMVRNLAAHIVVRMMVEGRSEIHKTAEVEHRRERVGVDMGRMGRTAKDYGGHLADRMAVDHLGCMEFASRLQ